MRGERAVPGSLGLTLALSIQSTFSRFLGSTLTRTRPAAEPSPWKATTGQTDTHVSMLPQIGLPGQLQEIPDKPVARPATLLLSGDKASHMPAGPFPALNRGPCWPHEGAQALGKPDCGDSPSRLVSF